MQNNLIVVESPTKVKTITKYLGSNYDVVATYGHIRDLPSKQGSVDIDSFDIIYENTISQANLAKLVNSVKKSKSIYLATDPDREGEAIAWHVQEILKELSLLEGKTISRVSFNEITKNAVLEAIQDPRDIDYNLVHAQTARRALDYLVGFNLSPVLWRRIRGSKSAGRVQSSVLKIICDKEEEIRNFIPVEYWLVNIKLAIPASDHILEANLTHWDAKKITKFGLNKDLVEDIKGFIATKNNLTVQNITIKNSSRSALPPFITSSLQQVASSILSFSPDKTLSIAQQLYEGVSIGGKNTGLITYMRTDGFHIAQEALNSIRGFISENYPKDYLPEKPNFYKSKIKNKQEAHEAIRPANINQTPGSIKEYLTKQQFDLYKIIWERTVACQMTKVQYEHRNIDFVDDSNKSSWSNSNTKITFLGFKKIYKHALEDHDITYNNLDLKIGDTLDINQLNTGQFFTKHPNRYTSAGLIKKMEELGIGRPSTYASMVNILQKRQYAQIKNKAFLPTDLGEIVNAFLSKFFEDYVSYEFTASMEDKLDIISSGQCDWKVVLKEFVDKLLLNVANMEGITSSVVIDYLNDKLEKLLFYRIDTEEISKICPKCKKADLSLKFGKYGAFLGCSGYKKDDKDSCNNIVQIGSLSSDPTTNDNQKSEELLIGESEDKKEKILLKDGRYGRYLQYVKEGSKEKPKNLKLGKLDESTLDFKKAAFLFSLPAKIIDIDGSPVSLAVGRFGYYLLHNDDKYSISVGDIFNLNEANISNIMKNKQAKTKKAVKSPKAKTATSKKPRAKKS